MNKEYRIGQAIEILEANKLEILTVIDWAAKLGYSRSHFSRSFKKEFGLSPKDFLKDFRLSVIEEEVKKDPEAIGYKIAVNCGFIDEKALHKYLSFHFSTTLTQFKAQVQ